MKGFCLEKVEDKEATEESVEGAPEDRPQNQVQQNAPVHQHLGPREARKDKSNVCWSSFFYSDLKVLKMKRINRETEEEILKMI